MKRRADLVALVDSAPRDLRPLADVALRMHDRWELIDSLRALHECVRWCDDDPWRDRMVAHLRAVVGEMRAARDDMRRLTAH